MARKLLFWDRIKKKKKEHPRTGRAGRIRTAFCWNSFVSNFRNAEHRCWVSLYTPFVWMQKFCSAFSIPGIRRTGIYMQNWLTLTIIFFTVEWKTSHPLLHQPFLLGDPQASFTFLSIFPKFPIGLSTRESNWDFCWIVFLAHSGFVFPEGKHGLGLQLHSFPENLRREQAAASALQPSSLLNTFRTFLFASLPGTTQPNLSVSGPIFGLSHVPLCFPLHSFVTAAIGFLWVYGSLLALSGYNVQMCF